MDVNQTLRAVPAIRVQDAAGDELGKIRFLVVEPESQVPVYAVLVYRPSGSLQRRLFGFPLNELALGFDGEQLFFRVGLLREDLELAPGFDRDDVPEAPCLARVQRKAETARRVRRVLRSRAANEQN